MARHKQPKRTKEECYRGLVNLIRSKIAGIQNHVYEGKVVQAYEDCGGLQSMISTAMEEINETR